MRFKFLKFSIFNAFRRKSTLLLSTIGTGLGIALMATLISLSNGMNAQLNETVNLVATDITVSADGGGFTSIFGGGDPLNLSLQQTFEKIDNVELVQPRVSTNIQTDSDGFQGFGGIFLLGLDIESDKELNGPTQNIIEGNSIKDEFDVIVGSEIKKQSTIRGNKVKIGDIIEVPIYYEKDEAQELPNLENQTTLPNTQSQLISAPAPDEVINLKIVGFYETGNNFDDNRYVSNIDIARKIAKINEDQVSNFLVKANDSENVDQVADDIEFEARLIGEEISVSISKDILGELNNVLDIFESFILIIALVAAVSGGMSIFIIMLMSVMERLQEFGIFKATGWSNFSVISSVILESITVSFIGAFAGLSVSFLLGIVINNFLGEEIAVINTYLITLVISFGLIMGVLGGLYPAIKAARVSPIKTLQSL